MDVVCFQEVSVAATAVHDFVWQFAQELAAGFG